MQGAVEMSTPVTRKQVHEARRVRNGQLARPHGPAAITDADFPSTAGAMSLPVSTDNCSAALVAKAIRAATNWLQPSMTSCFDASATGTCCVDWQQY